MKKENYFDNLIITLYTYFLSGFLGWQIFSFINVFFQLNQSRIQYSLQKWMEVQLNYFPIAAGTLIILLFMLFRRNSIRQKGYALNYLAFKFHIIYLLILLIITLINYLLYLNQLHQNILELINLVFAVLCLTQLSKLFYVQEKSAWFHPTTLSTFYIASALLGISQLLIFDLVVYPFSGYAYFLIGLLLIEMLRIFTRFKYLTKYNYKTNMIARSLLGKYGVYFGVRVIVGIFMPMVYIIYALYSNDGLFQGVGALIIIGEFIERLLFIYLSDTKSD